MGAELLVGVGVVEVPPAKNIPPHSPHQFLCQHNFLPVYLFVSTKEFDLALSMIDTSLSTLRWIEAKRKHNCFLNLISLFYPS